MVGEIWEMMGFFRMTTTHSFSYEIRIKIISYITLYQMIQYFNVQQLTFIFFIGVYIYNSLPLLFYP